MLDAVQGERKLRIEFFPAFFRAKMAVKLTLNSKNVEETKIIVWHD